MPYFWIYTKTDYNVTVPTASPYGVFPGQAQLYAAAQGPPPTYDQALAHTAIVGQQVTYEVM